MNTMNVKLTSIRNSFNNYEVSYAAPPRMQGPSIIKGIQARNRPLKGISAEFQVIRGFSQKIPADLLSYDKIHS